MMGGGYRNFYGEPSLNTPKVVGLRKDSKNLLDQWVQIQKSKGRKYKLIFDKTELTNLNPSKTDYLFGKYSIIFDSFNMQKTQSLSRGLHIN